jgi:hypothetical protein
VPTPAPVTARSAPAPAPPRPATPVPAAPAPGDANPFADLGAAPAPVPVPVPPKAPRHAEPEDLPPEEPPRKPRKTESAEKREEAEPAPRTGRDRRQTGGSPIALILVAGYALVMTGLAVYGLFFKSSDKLDTGHPLSTIPDNFGEFDPVSRKKVTQYKFPVDGELPAAQRAGLGGKIAIGQLEVQPVKIEKRRLVIETEGAKGGEQLRQFTNPALVLTVSIRNTGDLSIFPMDPAFTRRASGIDKPITRLVVGGKTFAGGFIEWPLDPDRIKRKIEVQQANDSIPLKPGETREYVVFTDAKPEIVNAVEAAKESIQWRVQVRRGLIDFKGKEIPVTAIIGVDFKPSEVKQPD